MNIFYTGKCPYVCAQNLDDKRVVKMVLETAQLLSTAIHAAGNAKYTTYKPTHVNHPCSIWARESSENYAWLLHHFYALLGEYEYRYNRLHACARLVSELRDGYIYMPVKTMTPHAVCTPNVEKSTPVETYREYMRLKWANDKRIPQWTSRNQPEWG